MKLNDLQRKQTNTLLAIGCIILASLSRIILPPFLGHPGNFSPIDGIALFSGACFGRRFLSFLIPLLSVWISDMIVDFGIYHKFMWFYPGFYWQYLAYVVIVLIGFALAGTLKNNQVSKLIPGVLGTSFLASITFFIISNFGVWATNLPHPMYAHNLQGLLLCFTFGLPFFPHTLLSDVLYSSVLFGSFYLIRIKNEKIIPISA